MIGNVDARTTQGTTLRVGTGARRRIWAGRRKSSMYGMSTFHRCSKQLRCCLRTLFRGFHAKRPFPRFPLELRVRLWRSVPSMHALFLRLIRSANACRFRFALLLAETQTCSRYCRHRKNSVYSTLAECAKINSIPLSDTLIFSQRVLSLLSIDVFTLITNAFSVSAGVAVCVCCHSRWYPDQRSLLRDEASKPLSSNSRRMSTAIEPLGC